MREFIVSRWRKLRTKRSHHVNKPAPPLPSGPSHAQTQSLVFAVLPTEVRLGVYRGVLAEPGRLLHVLHSIPDQGLLAQMGHWRCDDEHNPHLTWQHRCFGTWVEGEANEAKAYRIEHHSNRDLLSILLVCRLAYLEAKEILYGENCFDFRGAMGLIRFHSLLPPQNWQMLRHLHISTLFRTPMKPWLDCGLPPENYNSWKTCCQALETLTSLHTLDIKMIIWNDWGHYDPTLLEQDALESNQDALYSHYEALLHIFRALAGVKAHVFKLELNFELPSFVEDVLHPHPFEVIVRERPYDRITFL